MISIPNKKVELFCGTGGVGKTTVATARAVSLASEGRRVLLITIDPAKRLKQILNLPDIDDGAVNTISLDLFNGDKNQTFDAMLMSPGATLKRIATKKGLEKEFESTIIKTLSRPYGGMNEIMSIIEVQYQLERDVYDTIILDTPPGKHFIDFLESSEKINNFFDKSFLEIFEYLGRSIHSSGVKSKNIFTMMISTGVKKLLSYLEDVTGADFVMEFIDAVLALYKSRDSFLNALDFQKQLKNENFSNWFLVTSVEQQKIDEAQGLKNQAENFIHNDFFLVINKCLTPYLNAWNPKENTPLFRLKTGMVLREANLTEFASKNFRNVLKFHEINNPSPLEHVKGLPYNLRSKRLKKVFMEIKINTKEELENFICRNWDDVNAYIENLKKDLPIPFYSSVDVRESKFKYAPVDHNMYPAGFNNLCSADLRDAIKVTSDRLKRINPNAKMIGIFPESNTKNLMYLDHLSTLGKLVEDAGYQVRFLSFDPTLFGEGQDCLALTSHSGFHVTICKATIEDGELIVNGQKMDQIICNNDQSNPWPIQWSDIKTPISPTPKIGWFRRQKNTHFSYYKKVADEFSAHFGINSDLLQAKFKGVEDVDFEQKNGLEKLGSAVDEVINQLKPGSKVFVKASQGTYGMGISVVSSGEEIINMNRKTRNKMDIGKNSIKFTSLLVQEGVETIIKYDDMPAEITIYLIDGESIGGFMRVNGEKDNLGNLNSRGMVFRKLCMGDVVDSPEDHTTKEAMYSVVARLATIAAAYEIKEVL